MHQDSASTIDTELPAAKPPATELDGVRIGAALACFLLGALVVRLISQGQSPARILVECVLIGAVVYLATVVVRPPASKSRNVLQPVEVQVPSETEYSEASS